MTIHIPKPLLIVVLALAAQHLCSVTMVLAQPTIRYFVDLNYSFSPSSGAEQSLRRGSFELGQFDMFTSYEITDKIDVLAELVFEAPPGTTELVVDLERIEIGYAFGDYLSIRMGRFHSPLGYYANAFHHGRVLESAVRRPLFLEFEDEGGLLPAHAVGVWARGQFITRPGIVQYHLGIVNGQKIDLDDRALVINFNNDDNRNKPLLAALVFEPKAVKGLGMGASMYTGTIHGYTSAKADTPVVEVDQWIAGANVYYDELPLQLLAEYYVINNTDMMVQPSRRFTTSAYFVQCAYEFRKRYRPYFRYEHITPEAGDPYTGTLVGERTLSVLTAGFRYNVSLESAIKIEGSSRRSGDETIMVLALQWALMF